jgi:hypothetical protein
VAVDVRDLVVLAQQLQLSTGGVAQPFAEQLLTIAARIAARIDQHHGAPAALIEPGGTVYQGATLRDVGNATHVLALGLRGGSSQAESGETPPQAPVLKPGEAVPPAPIRPGDAVPPVPVLQLALVPRQRDGGILGQSPPEGGSNQSVIWEDISKEEGRAVYLLAIVFVGIIAASPVAPFLKPGSPPPTKGEYCESFCLLVWLFGGLYLFTHVILFQSPHFLSSRTLSLEESVYLISQIVTTVGYGDVTPAEEFGQVVIGFYAFVSTMLVTQMISNLVNSFEDVMERRLSRALARVEAGQEGEETPRTAERSRRQNLWDAFVPVINCGLVFVFFVILGSVFFCWYPGEGKTLEQAIYMSTITLSTVGFGAFTPVTRTGMVFGSYWMLFGVGSLGALVSARVAFSSALTRYEREAKG